MNYLVDTDWVIDHLRGRSIISNRLEELAPDGLALSIISLAELYEGIYYSRDPVRSEEAFLRFLNQDLDVLGIDEETCQIFGTERGRLRRDGRSIGDLDLLIAATCLRHDLTLLSNNRRHFERVDGLTMISA